MLRSAPLIFSTAVPVTEAPPSRSASSPSDALAASVTDQHPRTGGEGDELVIAIVNSEAQRQQCSKHSQQKANNSEGVPDWFYGDKQKYNR